MINCGRDETRRVLRISEVRGTLLDWGWDWLPQRIGAGLPQPRTAYRSAAALTPGTWAGLCRPPVVRRSRQLSGRILLFSPRSYKSKRL